MTEDFSRLDRELADLGAQWRAGTPPDVVVDETALRRAASRRLGWVAAGAAAAVVIGAVLGARTLLPGNDDPVSPADSAPEVVNRLDCAPPKATPVTGAPVVPDGAVAIRMCGRERNASGFDAAWPGDTLTGPGAKALNAGINDLTALSPGSGPSCARTEPFALVLRYDDGSRVWVRGGGGEACERLTVRGGKVWGGASAISDLALQLIDDQRTGRSRPHAPIPPLCPQDWQNVASTIGVGPIAADDVVAMTACQYRLDTAGGFSLAAPDATGRLDLQAVVGDPAPLLGTALRGPTTDPCTGRAYRLATTQRVLVLRDVYGDIQVVSTERCWPNDLSGAQRYPTPGLADQVADLFGQAP